ncbi:HEAT repeat domain-containing protein [Myxococcus sp. K38C18041901]|uniref:HEAT repeat domain-containing protein n=1 Tax=Myxococcus guangdongensis TaxID=2906760 RepID=UPI0020A728D6|nr:HEAT repeat domain-containing protein [Myxococcus guangdongensis]MCP3061579.1 HEAT repeat domain-containing protein [Myxococcus guangdongensis]
MSPACHPRVFWSLLLLLLCPLQRAEARKNPHLQALVQDLVARANDSHDYIDEKAQESARQIQAYRAEAIPSLMALLESPSERVRRHASHALSDIEGLNAKHLPALLRAHARGSGYIEVAIGRLGSARAIDWLIRQLMLQPQGNVHVTQGLVIAGSDAAVALAETLRGSTSLDPLFPMYVNAVCGVLWEMQAGARGGVSALLSVAMDDTVSPRNRWHAIRLLGCIGPSARSSLPSLEQLAGGDGTFRVAVEETRKALHPPAELPKLLETLHDEPSAEALLLIGNLLSRADSAGADVLPFLDSKKWNVKLAAIQVLGAIQHRGATASLINLLEDSEDWQRVYFACKSLGAMHAVEALPSLKRVARRHVMSDVRNAAYQAMDIIRHRSSYSDRFAPLRPPLTREAMKPSPDTVVDDGPGAISRAELDAIDFAALVPEHAMARPAQVPVPPGPDCGMRVSDGRLLGSNPRFWGGTLVHVGDDGGVSRVLTANVSKLHRLGRHLVAVTGTFSRYLDEGMLYRIIQEGDGYVARPWRALPGQALKSGLLLNGRLFVSTRRADIVIDSEGRIELATPGRLK